MSTIQSQPSAATLPSSSTVLPPQDNQGKTPFTPPKLTFVTPELTKQGSVEKLTAGIIGTFS